MKASDWGWTFADERLAANTRLPLSIPCGTPASATRVAAPRESESPGTLRAMLFLGRGSTVL